MRQFCGPVPLSQYLYPKVAVAKFYAINGVPNQSLSPGLVSPADRHRLLTASALCTTTLSQNGYGDPHLKEELS